MNSPPVPFSHGIVPCIPSVTSAVTDLACDSVKSLSLIAINKTGKGDEWSRQTPSVIDLLLCFW